MMSDLKITDYNIVKDWKQFLIVHKTKSEATNEESIGLYIYDTYTCSSDNSQVILNQDHLEYINH